MSNVFQTTRAYIVSFTTTFEVEVQSPTAKDALRTATYELRENETQLAANVWEKVTK